LLSDSDKKYHQGWGGDDGNTELKTEQQARVDAVAEGNEWGADSAPATDWATPAADGGAETTATPADGEKVEGGRPRREREPEEEDNTLTLDQYIAQQKEKESALLPKLEGPRQIDTDAWKDVTPLEKSGEDSYFAGKVIHSFSSPLVQPFTSLHRPNLPPKPAPRKKKRYSLRSMRVSIVPIVAVVVAAAAVIEVVEAIGVVVVPEVAVQPETKSSMSMTKLRSLRYLKILYQPSHFYPR
jgi:hypothetical protein